MVENTKCSCGHNNPVGTILCENCGRPLQSDIEKMEQGSLDMRYEGAARRSQKRKKSWIDRIWYVFSSVKFAIFLIVITLLASVIGTILPQEMYVPSVNKLDWYEQQYGVLGVIYYKLGFGQLYNSWWYVTLLALIGISLVVCSLDRVIPLYKALNRQRIKKDTSFIAKQHVAAVHDLDGADHSQLLDRITESLSAKRYNVRREQDAILAEKGRVSRWGPYINHIGLIIFLLGTLMRLIPGWYLDEYVWVREGETQQLTGTEYWVKNERAVIEFYDPEKAPEKLSVEGQIAKQYQTNVTLYEKNGSTGELQPVKSGAIEVNHPLKYEGVSVYQSGFQPNTVDALEMVLVDQDTGESVDKFEVDLENPESTYALDKDITVHIVEYYPDFELQDGQPITRSPDPNRPAFVFEVVTPDNPEGEKSWVISGLDVGNLPGSADNRYDINMSDIQFLNVSGLSVRIDKSLPIIFSGAGLFMIGVIIGFYWQHRRVWVNVKGEALYLGAHTNKNWYGLRQEIKRAVTPIGLRISEKPKSKEATR